MVLYHGDGGVGDVALLGGESSVQVLVVPLTQLLDDDGGVSDLLAVDLHEGQLTLLALVLHLVVNILEREKKGVQVWCWEVTLKGKCIW